MSVRRVDPPVLSGPGHGIRPRSPAELLEPARAPEPPRGRRVRHREGRRRLSGFVRVISGVMTVALVLMASVGAAGLFFSYQFTQPGPLEAARTIAIPRGEGRIQIASRLEREGIIASRWTFLINHMFKSYFGDGRVNMQAGEYEFPKHSSMSKVLDTLVSGKAVLYKFAVPEGLTSQQIVERMRASEDLTGEIVSIPAEGSLLPDTYRFSKGMDRQELIKRMQLEAQNYLQRVWSERQEGLPIKTPEEAVILASIVEKETGVKDERERVAGVFINRLNKGMRLQSDPTIIYGIAGGKGSLGRPIYRTDINQKTPYNTYQIDGLPKGPICNPGREALRAVLNPAKTKEFYFVADGTGGHIFSETLKQHNRAVANWRKVERDARKAKKAAAAAANDPEAPEGANTEGSGPSVASNVAAAAADSGAIKLLSTAEDAATAGGNEKATAPADAQGTLVSIPLPERKSAP